MSVSGIRVVQHLTLELLKIRHLEAVTKNLTSEMWKSHIKVVSIQYLS